MSSSAKKFILNRLNRNAITQSRINDILSYIVYCHSRLVSNNVKYSRLHVKENTTDKFENYLKKRLVHDYLKTLKKEYAFKSAIEDILFECEPEMPYYYFDENRQRNIEANDRIDIKVNSLGLQNVWKETDEQDIYFAIECKILKIISDNNEYLKDIQKFSDRNHYQFRLPIEGMIAFKESKLPSTEDYVIDLNKRLNSSGTITTTQLLKKNKLMNNYKDYYSSKHKRNFDTSKDFIACHLYLDYSEIIEP